MYKLIDEYQHCFKRSDLDFGIYIDDIEIGENLKNGLVGEVIDKASIEDAVIALSKDKDQDKVNASNLC